MSKNYQTCRPEEIKTAYLQLIDKHLDDLLHNRADCMMEIEDFANALHIHPVHLSGTIKELTGISPCGLYQPKILKAAKRLLIEDRRSIRDIALQLTFEPSHFTKWFKKMTGVTPGQLRKSLNQDHFS